MKRAKLLTAFLIVSAMLLAGIAVMIIKNAPSSGSLKYGIFSNIEDLSFFEEYTVANEAPKSDPLANNFAIKESWACVVDVDGAKCAVTAYVFETRDDAAEYYKKASNRTKLNDGANGSASAGGLFGEAEYVTMNDENVLVITGKTISDISKVLDKFFEAVPNALTPFINN